MKDKLIKLVMTALLGLGGMATANSQAIYNNDLIVGFTSTSGNDALYDLGTKSSLTNGKAWNLNSLISDYNLPSVYWGVIGTVSTNHTSFLTYDPNVGVFGATPPPVPSQPAWTPINTSLKALYSNFAVAGAGESATVGASTENSWNTETLNPTLGTDYANENVVPNTTGETTVAFFEQTDDGSNPTQLGNFTLSANGVLTFNTLSIVPPAPQIVSVQRSGNTSTISFTTASGSFTYMLFYTNSAGLTSPTTNWPTSTASIIGNGSTNSLSDTTADANRFYRVGVQ